MIQAFVRDVERNVCTSLKKGSNFCSLGSAHSNSNTRNNLDTEARSVESSAIVSTAAKDVIQAKGKVCLRSLSGRPQIDVRAQYCVRLRQSVSQTEADGKRETSRFLVAWSVAGYAVGRLSAGATDDFVTRTLRETAADVTVRLALVSAAACVESAENRIAGRLGYLKAGRG